VDKKNTSVGWVFDFFVIPICSDYLEEKKEWKNHWFWLFENFQNQKNHWVRVFHKKNKITESLKNRSGKCEGPGEGDRRVKEPEWEMWRTGRGGSTG
jgi:hypothetical protein